MKNLIPWILLTVTLSTTSPTTVINVYNAVGEWTDVTVSTKSVQPTISKSSCAYMAADANNCYFSCILSNGAQSSYKWVGNVCPAVIGQ